MNKAIGLITVLVVSAVIGTAVWHWQDLSVNPATPQQGEADARRRPPTPVTTAVAQSATVKTTEQSVGTLQAQEKVTLTSQVSGIIKAIRFQEGRQVKQGDLLVELDTDQEQARLAEAEAQLEEARRQHQRGQTLLKRKVIAQAELDELEAAFETAAAKLEVVRSNISDHRIVAPFSGRIGLREVSPGVLLKPGDEIATLTRIDPIDLRFDVPADLLPRIETGMPVLAQAEGFGEREFHGKLNVIDTLVDEQTRSVTLQADLPNEDRALQPGLFMNVELVLETRENRITVPEEALLLRGNEKYLFVVNNDNSVHRVTVETGQRREGDVEILQGIDAGARVVTGGLQKIRDGQTVSLTSEQPQQKPAPAGEES